MTYYKRKFSLFKDVLIKPSSRSSSRNRRWPLSQHCPWTWTVNTDTERKPQKIPVASCPSCDNLRCKLVQYNHNVLVRREDCRTGEKVWSWKLQPLPIAYVYVLWSGDWCITSSLIHKFTMTLSLIFVPLRSRAHKAKNSEPVVQQLWTVLCCPYFSHLSTTLINIVELNWV